MEASNMKMDTNKLTPILLILLVALLCLTLISLFSLQNTKAARASVEQKLKQAETMIDNLQDKLDKSNKTVLQLTEQINDKDTQITALTAELDQIKSSSEVTISERDNLKLELENLKVSKEELLTNLNNAQKELEEVKSQLSAITKEKESLDRKLKDLQASTGIQLDKIIVSYPETETGEVLEINKEYDFIVVNLGQEDNIGVGQMFYIYQDNNLLGEAKVEKVQDLMSVATIQDPNVKSQIKVGDVVKLKK
jgi:septal ring factor EnvC (AmiA/AmiB activator)